MVFEALEAIVLYIMYRLDERQRRELMGLLGIMFGKGSAIPALVDMSSMGKTTIYNGANQTQPIVDLLIQGETVSEETFSSILDGKEGNGYIAPVETPTYYEETAPAGLCPEADNMRKPEKRGRNQKNKKDPKTAAKKRQRRIGAGAKKFAAIHPTAFKDIYDIVSNLIAGNPSGEGLYLSTTIAHIRDGLLALKNEDGTPRYPQHLSLAMVRKLLIEMGFSLQRNKKMAPPVQYHTDRDLQFRTIGAVRGIEEIQNGKILLLSCDEKKSENLGNFSRPGPEWREIGCPRETKTYDFYDGRPAIPYAIYDVGKNHAYVSIGVSRSTAEFSGNFMYYYLKNIAPVEHPGFKTVVILCDGGGNNSSRSRLWKAVLEKIASELGITIFVMHYPPYTSKHNPVEHRVFSEISKNWRGHPLDSLDTMKHYIESTRTKTGLKVDCFLDSTEYETGHTLSNKEFKKLMDEHVAMFDSNGWNYMIYGDTNPLEDIYSEASVIANTIRDVVRVPEAGKAAEATIAAFEKAKKDLNLAEKKVAEKPKAYEKVKQLAERETAKLQHGSLDAESRSALVKEYARGAANQARALGRVKSTAAKRAAARDEAVVAAANALMALAEMDEDAEVSVVLAETYGQRAA